jgi:negative regulator of flagellin synthesis FlgM
MIMIDGISGGGPARGAPSPRAAGDGISGVGGSDPARPTARVSALSGITGRPPGGLVAELAKAPPVDSTRVAALREAIAQGRYQIDPGAIADAMLRLEGGR